MADKKAVWAKYGIDVSVESRRGGCLDSIAKFVSIGLLGVETTKTQPKSWIEYELAKKIRQELDLPVEDMLLVNSKIIERHIVWNRKAK